MAEKKLRNTDALGLNQMLVLLAAATLLEEASITTACNKLRSLKLPGSFHRFLIKVGPGSTHIIVRLNASEHPSMASTGPHESKFDYEINAEPAILGCFASLIAANDPGFQVSICIDNDEPVMAFRAANELFIEALSLRSPSQREQISPVLVASAV